VRAVQDIFAQLQGRGVLQSILTKLTYRQRCAYAAPVCQALAKGARINAELVEQPASQSDVDVLLLQITSDTHTNLVGLKLTNFAVTLDDYPMDWNLADLDYLPNLKRLQLEGFSISFEPVSDEQRKFAGLVARQVKQLSLRYCVIGGVDLSLFGHIKGLLLHDVVIQPWEPELNPVLRFSDTLQHLELSGSALSSRHRSSRDTLKTLGGCKKLRVLRLGGVNDLTQPALAGLPALTQLTSLHLHDAPQLVLTAGGPISRLQELKCFRAKKIGGMDAQLVAAIRQQLNM